MTYIRSYIYKKNIIKSYYADTHSQIKKGDKVRIRHLYDNNFSNPCLSVDDVKKELVESGDKSVMIERIFLV
jgi:hypothetical protein